MSLNEAYVLALTVLKQVMEEKVDETNVQLAQVTPDGTTAKFEILSEAALKEIIAGMA